MVDPLFHKVLYAEHYQEQITYFSSLLHETEGRCWLQQGNDAAAHTADVTLVMVSVLFLKKLWPPQSPDISSSVSLYGAKIMNFNEILKDAYHGYLRRHFVVSWKYNIDIRRLNVCYREVGAHVQNHPRKFNLRLIAIS
jgi:hypothetical protein